MTIREPPARRLAASLAARRLAAACLAISATVARAGTIAVTDLDDVIDDDVGPSSTWDQMAWDEGHRELNGRTRRRHDNEAH